MFPKFEVASVFVELVFMTSYVYGGFRLLGKEYVRDYAINSLYNFERFSETNLSLYGTFLKLRTSFGDLRMIISISFMSSL